MPLRSTLTLRERTYDQIANHLFNNGPNERAAYLYCNVAETEEELRLVAASWEPVVDADVDYSSPTEMTIDARSYRLAMKRADRDRHRLLFLHSHPSGPNRHSPRDDVEENALFRTGYIRIHNAGPHGSVVFAGPTQLSGRLWYADGSVAPISLVRIIGSRFRFISANRIEEDLPAFYERQVRAFGSDIQRLLRSLHIGIVGVGGTGSSVAEQLIRLGVGWLTIADGDRFDDSNVSRVYGSSASDDTIPKVAIASRNAERIGLGTRVEFLDRPIMHESVLRRFVSCDAVFCCVDKELPRSLLNDLSLYYIIPVIDMGTEVDSHNGAIRSVAGRVSTLMPGYACLFCRGVLTEDVVITEATEFASATEATRLRATIM